jgi:hypothetical protein
VLVRVADHGDTNTVRLMLQFGIPPDVQTGVDRATALHSSAGAGSMETVRLLLVHGATVDARDGRWHATPLARATVGSGIRLGRSPHPDWVTTFDLLLAAGADPSHAWGDR